MDLSIQLSVSVKVGLDSRGAWRDVCVGSGLFWVNFLIEGFLS